MDTGSDFMNMEPEHLTSKISALEKRVRHIESLLGLKYASYDLLSDTAESNDTAKEHVKINGPESGLESRIGGYILALLGNIVLLFGIIFLSQYINNNNYPLLTPVFGCFSIICILFLANYSKKKVAHLSSMFTIVGQLLIFYFTLRLHFFTDKPLVSNPFIADSLIFIVVAYQLYLTFKKRSEVYAIIAVVLALTTGFISNSSIIILTLGPVVAGVATYLLYRYGWKRTFILSLFLIYINFFVWFLVFDPAYFKTIQSVTGIGICHYFLMVVAAIFSVVCLITKKENLSGNFILSTILINGTLFSLIMALVISSYFKNNYTVIFLVISSFCMVFSIILKSRSGLKFTPALYAMYGFVSVSIAIYGIFKLPYTFLLLAFQSLYVLIIALWFRSKIIVVINAFLFFMLLTVYLYNSEPVNSINFAFAGVSIITANILFRKREVLGIQTELIRYVYMIFSFLMVLFALYKSVSGQYVTLSWVAAGIIYFAYSIVFKDVKYRLMAISTLLAAAFYLFLVDLSKISLAYRVIAFLFLAVISIILSLYYSKTRKITESNDEKVND